MNDPFRRVSFRWEFLRAVIRLLADKRTEGDDLLALLLDSDDWSVEEIGELLGFAKSTVSRRIHAVSKSIEESGLLRGYENWF